MCVFYIVYLFVSSKARPEFISGSKVQLINQNENLESGSQYRVSGIQQQTSSAPKVDFASLNILSAKGGFHFVQHQLRQRRISLRSTSTLFLIPGIWFLLTTLWSSYPIISATRALYFILISAGSISAGILWIRFSGKSVLDFLLPANIFIVLLALFSLISNIPSDSWTGGHGKSFMGFFGHQNQLGSLLLFTIPAVFLKLWKQDGVNSNQSSVNGDQLTVNSNRIKLKLQLTTHNSLLTFYSLLLTANLLLLTLTYSRASILSLIFGVILFLILSRNWKVISYGFGIVILFLLINYFTPPLNQFTDKIIKKDFPEFYSSRMWMFEPSYRAAINGGLTGLGYGISHPEIRSGEYSDRFEDGRLIREKGNSILALVEETGLIGLILFTFPLIVMIVKNKVKLHSNLSLLTTHYSLLTAALAAFIFHAQFEGWWVGVGSVQLPLFFLYVGLLVQSSKFSS